MKFSVKLPITVRVNNVHAIFMASNITIMSCMNTWISGTSM